MFTHPLRPGEPGGGTRRPPEGVAPCTTQGGDRYSARRRHRRRLRGQARTRELQEDMPEHPALCHAAGPRFTTTRDVLQGLGRRAHRHRRRANLRPLGPTHGAVRRAGSVQGGSRCHVRPTAVREDGVLRQPTSRKGDAGVPRGLAAIAEASPEIRQVRRRHRREPAWAHGGQRGARGRWRRRRRRLPSRGGKRRRSPRASDGRIRKPRLAPADRLVRAQVPRGERRRQGVVDALGAHPRLAPPRDVPSFAPRVRHRVGSRAEPRRCFECFAVGRRPWRRRVVHPAARVARVSRAKGAEPALRRDGGPGRSNHVASTHRGRSRRAAVCGG